MALECLRRRAEHVLHSDHAVIHSRGPSVTPQGDFRQTLVQGREYPVTNACICGEYLGADRQTLARRGPSRLQVQSARPEDPQRPAVAAVRQQYGHLPTGHHPVVQPTPGRLHDVDGADGNDVESISQMLAVGASCPGSADPSASADVDSCDHQSIPHRHTRTGRVGIQGIQHAVVMGCSRVPPPGVRR